MISRGAGKMHEICADSCALFLDVDGTLVDIQPTPNDVFAADGLVSTLQDLMVRLNGALAIVSGRRIEEIDRILSPIHPIAAGVHGVEMRRAENGTIETGEPTFSHSLLRALQNLKHASPGIVIETKYAAVSVHYRQAPEMRAWLEDNLRRLISAHHQDMELGQGRMVFEIIPRGTSKGRAVRDLMRLPLFAGRIPIMIGDDSPDLSAVHTATEMGGYGLTVAGEFFAKEVSYFNGPAHVRSWLRDFSRQSHVILP